MTNHPNRFKAPLPHYRQGDVLFARVKEIPSAAREVPADKNGRVIVARGEMTGHEHAFRDKGICSLSTLDSNEIEFMLVGGGGATLRHEFVSGKKAEHDQIEAPPGKYEFADQVEFSPAAIVRVTD